MAGTVAAWLPWFLAEAPLGWVETQLWPAGGFWLTVLWTAVLLLFRGMVSLTNERRERLFIDAVFAVLCLLAAFEGGWYVLPGVAAFAMCDAAGFRIRLPALPRDARGHEVRLAVAAAFVGWAGLAIAISGPIYATETSTIEPDGTIVSTHSPAPLLETGVALPLAVALIIVAVLFALVAVTAAVHLWTGRGHASVALIAVTVSLVAAVVSTVGTLGLSLVPGAVLAVAAALVDRRSRAMGRRSQRPL